MPDGVGVAVVEQVRFTTAASGAAAAVSTASRSGMADRSVGGAGGGAGPVGSASQEGHEVLTRICSAAPTVSVPKAYSLAGDGNEETAAGLSLELFRMRLQSPHHVSQEVMRYLAYIAVDCTANEPQTQARRDAVIWARRRRQLLIGGAVLAVVGTAAAAYTWHRGTRTAVDSLVSRVRGAVGGWWSLLAGRPQPPAGTPVAATAVVTGGVGAGSSGKR